jgi:hypothetical protein
MKGCGLRLKELSNLLESREKKRREERAFRFQFELSYFEFLFSIVVSSRIDTDVIELFLS